MENFLKNYFNFREGGSRTPCSRGFAALGPNAKKSRFRFRYDVPLVKINPSHPTRLRKPVAGK